jgi:ribosomal protein S18 acetylase RimI-like enzyme
MDASFTIRPATVDDAEELAQVNVDTWRSAYAGIMPDDVLAGLDLGEWTARKRQQLSEPGPFTTLVATAGPAIVGFVSYGPYRIDSQTDGEPVPAGEVLAVYVHPKRQGAGAGRALMDAAAAGLRRQGFPELRLWVLEDNAPSRRFYERYGLVTDGERDIFRMRRPGGLAMAELVEVRYTMRLG